MSAFGVFCLLMLLISFVAFALHAFGVKFAKVDLLGLGLALWILCQLAAHFQK